MTEIAFKPDAGRRHWSHALTGPLEIACVMGASLAAAMMAAQFITPSLGTALGLGSDPEPDLMMASRSLGLQLAAQYAVLFGLAGIVGLLRGRRSATAYAVRAPHSGPTNPWGYGLVLGLLISIIPSIVFILQEVAPIGRDTPIWAALRTAPQDGAFWVFMAVGSFGLVPVLEELGWRSYVLGRLQEGFGSGAALLATTLLFAVLHIQYLSADAAMLLTFAGLLLASIGMGFVTLRTGSIWPAVIAHMMINFPLTTELNALRIGLALLALIVFRKAVGRELAALGRVLFRVSTLAVLPVLGVVAGLLLALTAFPGAALYLAAGLLLVLVATGFIRRSAWQGTKQDA